jgi:glycosyltransferase involved in cell wall biosynthesis
MPEHVGGTELYTRWLAHAQRRQGHQVAIFYRRSGEGSGWEKRMEDGVEVWAAWAGPVNPTQRFLATFRDPAMRPLFEHVLEETNPDLVHVEHLMGHPVSLIRSIRQHGLPYVITLWDFWWVCANANLLTNYSQQICDGPHLYLNCARCALARAGRESLWPLLPPVAGLMAWRNRLLAQVLRGAEKLLTPSEFVNRWYAAHGALVEKLLTLHAALELADKPARLANREEGPLRFVYIGGLSRMKGVHVIVEAFGGLRERGAAELWIAGDESFDPAYVAGLRAKSPPGVCFLGRLSREQVWETLAQANLVLAPSLCYETFSFILSEAFIAGVPVLASRLGALADRVRDGIDGLLLPPGDVAAWREALQRLVDDPDLVARLRSNVRPPMTMEEHANRMETLYNQIIG